MRSIRLKTNISSYSQPKSAQEDSVYLQYFSNSAKEEKEETMLSWKTASNKTDVTKTWNHCMFMFIKPRNVFFFLFCFLFFLFFCFLPVFLSRFIRKPEFLKRNRKFNVFHLCNPIFCKHLRLIWVGAPRYWFKHLLESIVGWVKRRNKVRL